MSYQGVTGIETHKTIYVAEGDDKWLKRARLLWPRESDSRILWNALREMVLVEEELRDRGEEGATEGQ